MKTQTIILFILIFIISCKNTATGPSTTGNLISNSSFAYNGVASLNGWMVPDTSAVHFSTDNPPTGSGHSIVFGVGWIAPWPSNSIYTKITGLTGTHRYRLSIFGKGVPDPYGGVYVSRNRPGNSTFFSSLPIRDTIWTFYSRIDTLTTTLSDTIFISVTGGGVELARQTSIYFNTCKFEKLD